MKYLLTLLLLCGAAQAHGPDDDPAVEDNPVERAYPEDQS